MASTQKTHVGQDNFHLWKSLLLSIVKGYRLYRYMLGTHMFLDEFITNIDSRKTLNPVIEDWKPYYT